MRMMKRKIGGGLSNGNQERGCYVPSSLSAYIRGVQRSSFFHRQQAVLYTHTHTPNAQRDWLSLCLLYLTLPNVLSIRKCFYRKAGGWRGKYLLRLNDNNLVGVWILPLIRFNINE